MAQSIKALFATSFAPPKYYGYFRNFCIAKDLTKATSSNILQQNGPDFLYQNLKTAPSPKLVLKLVHEHSSIMNSNHILQALRSIFDLQKYGNSELSTNQLLKHPDFEKLCDKLKSQSGVIELNETLEALKVITYVGVPSDSTIVQVLLQLIRQNINTMNLANIMFLQFLLSNYKSSPLVEALKLALPIVFEIQLPVKMDKSVAKLAEYLYFASKTNVSENTIKNIVDELYYSHEELDGQTAKSIVWSLNDLPRNPHFAPLLRKAIHTMVVHADTISYPDLEMALHRLLSNYSKKYPFYYSEVLCDTCANCVIDNDLGLRNSVYLLRKFNRVFHFNKHLLDYMAKQIVSKSNESAIDTIDVYTVVVGISLTNYRPIHWDKLKTIFQNMKNLSNIESKHIIWLKYASALCLLDIFKIDVLTKALNPQLLQSKLIKTGFQSDFECFSAVNQCFTRKRPELLDLIPTDYPVEKLVVNFKHVFEYPLEGPLNKGLGSEGFVKTNIFSKIGVQIDHAILFKKGGYPTQIEDDTVKFIEDIEIPPDSQLVVILALSPICYTINTKTLRECIAYSMDSLRHNGYCVVTVNMENWEELNDFEKIPYLMQSIKNAMLENGNNCDSITSNVS